MGPARLQHRQPVGPPFTPFSLLVCPSAWAQTKPPASGAATAADAPAAIYLLNNGHGGGAVSRTDMDVIEDSYGTKPFSLCMLAPAADWALASNDEGIEKKYLDLVSRAAYHNGQINGGRKAGTAGGCYDVDKPGEEGDAFQMNKEWLGVCNDPKPPKFPGGRYATLAGPGKKRDVLNSMPHHVILDSFLALLKSPHPSTVKRTLLTISTIHFPMVKNANPSADMPAKLSPFADAVSAVLLDTKAAEDVRIQASKTLAFIQPDNFAKSDLKSVWDNENETEAMRIAALHAFAWTGSWGDKSWNASPKATQAEIQNYLKPLMAINDEHWDEGKGRADALGSAAYCAGSTYPKALRDKALGRGK